MSSPNYPDSDISVVRQQRNLAEKQRRDKLNGYINELANLVPMVSMATKRLDKTSVLRLSAAYLRLNQTLQSKRGRNRVSKKQTQSNTSNLQPLLNNTSFENIKELLDSIDGFIVATTWHGKIIYVSQSVERFLGHQNIEMIGHSLTSFIHPADTDAVFNQIHHAYKQVIGGRQISDKISFRCRLRERNQPRSEVITYQMVHVTGQMAANKKEMPTITATTTTNNENEHIKEEMTEVEVCDDNESGVNKDSNGMNVLFKGFVQVIPTNPMAELSLMDANLDEYVTRHSLDGTLLFADHRISIITGHLPEEVRGKSAYEYILPDDHSISLFAHKLMLSNSSGTGNIVHRLRSRTGSFVFLQSSGCLQYDRSTGQVDHFVCVSRLLIEEEGDKEREKFVKRFTPHISNSSPTALYESLQIVIGPRSNNNYPYSEQSEASNIGSPIRIEELTNVSTPASPKRSSSPEYAICDVQHQQHQRHPSPQYNSYLHSPMPFDEHTRLHNLLSHSYD